MNYLGEALTSMLEGEAVHTVKLYKGLVGPPAREQGNLQGRKGLWGWVGW